MKVCTPFYLYHIYVWLFDSCVITELFIVEPVSTKWFNLKQLLAPEWVCIMFHKRKSGNSVWRLLFLNRQHYVQLVCLCHYVLNEPKHSETSIIFMFAFPSQIRQEFMD